LTAMARAADRPIAELAPGLLAWLGPCIGPRAFEVGAEVRAAFLAADPAAAVCFSPLAAGKYLADLAALARLRLRRLGVLAVYGNDGSDAWCTVRQSRFFSHRRCSSMPGALAGQTGGRMAACIWLD
jgi:polyphenol oxidase